MAKDIAKWENTCLACISPGCDPWHCEVTDNDGDEIMQQRYSSVVKCLPGMCKALGSSTSIIKTTKQKENIFHAPKPILEFSHLLKEFVPASLRPSCEALKFRVQQKTQYLLLCGQCLSRST